MQIQKVKFKNSNSENELPKFRDVQGGQEKLAAAYGMLRTKNLSMQSWKFKKIPKKTGKQAFFQFSTLHWKIFWFDWFWKIMSFFLEN